MKLDQLYGFIVRTYVPDGSRWPDYFGVELEIEDATVVQNTKRWVVKDDHSLRNGVEYILNEPLGGTELEAAIDEFYNLKCRYTNGPRTSTHIHVNVSDCTVDQMRAMFVMMYTIEDGLFSVIGELRKWAGYAMPLSEMDTKRLRIMLASKDMVELTNNISPTRNQERYYGFNTCVRKHGTVEFRYFPGGPTKAELCDWIDLVAAVKRASETPIETLLNIGNNQWELRNWLGSYLPESWLMRLENAMGLDAMLDKFLEVTAMLPEVEDIARRDRLVFVTKPLLRFIKKHLATEDGYEKLEGYAKQAPVMGQQDWNYYFGVALTSNPEPKVKKTKTEVLREQAREVVAVVDDPLGGVQWAVHNNQGNFWDAPPAEAQAAPAVRAPAIDQDAMARYAEVVRREQERRDERAREQLRQYQERLGAVVNRAVPPPAAARPRRQAAVNPARNPFANPYDRGAR